PLTPLSATATWRLAGRTRRLTAGRGAPDAAQAAAVAAPAAAAGALLAPEPPRVRAPAPPPVAPVPVRPPREEPRLYEGEILVTAGPFADMTALADFEARLAGLPLVHDVRVGHFEGDNVGINLRLAGPTDLAQEMRYEFGSEMAIRSVGDSELAAELTSPAT